ncbi:MAG: hypothetical protein IKG92_05010 [Bacteroidales bacterium]|nr:hypothetical protein [Bacteroidales bacterium]
MKKIFQLTSILAVLSLMVLSCAKETLSTDQYDSNVVALKAYGPQPVVRGGTLRFVGSNLDKVATVTIPGVDPIVPEVITSGEHSEIRVTVPKDGPIPGYPVLTLADGTTITGQTQITYSEPITLEEFAPAALYPGETLTVKGDYLNLIHEIVFNNKVIVSEDYFASHTRYEIKVVVPEEAQTGKFALGTVDETKVNADEAEGKALLATLNLIESATPLTVGTATATFPAEAIKGGNDVTFNGSHLLLVDEMYIGGDYEVQEFDASDTQITFYLSELAPDGVVELVMASGVRVAIGTLTTVTPSELAVSPKPVKAGAEMKVTGKDLDLVDNIAVGGAGISDFTCNEEGTEIVLTVPELAVEGDVLLIMVNRKEVTVPFTLVKPTYTAYGSNPVAAGSDLYITGKDLDLVAAVTFGGDIQVEVEATETLITVAVPTAAESGKVVLNLKNGTDVEFPELTIDKPAGAFIAVMPETVYSPGEMFIIDIENPDHLTGVQVDGEDVNYILNNATLYFQIPLSAKANSQLTLVSDNGSVTYTMNIDPGDFIVTPIWSAGFDCSGWNGNQDLAWGGYDWASVQPGMILRFELESTKPAGDWWCISLRHGDSWGALAGVPGQYDTPESPLDVVLTKEILDDLVANGGLVITGDGFHLSRICLVQDLRYGDPIWEGSFVCDGWNGNQDLAWGGYDWTQAKPGQTLFFHLTSNVAAGDWWCISLRHGDSWANIPGLPGQYDSPAESPFGVTLTADVIADLVANGGLVMTGTGYTITKVSLK